MGELVILNNLTSLDIPVERVINGLVEQKDNLEDVIIIGNLKNGEKYYASSSPNKANMIFNTLLFNKRILED